MKREFIKKASGKEKEIAAYESDGKSFFLLNICASSSTEVIAEVQKEGGSTFMMGSADSKNAVSIKISDCSCEVAFGDKKYCNEAEAIRAAGEHAVQLSYATRVDDGKTLLVPKSKFSVQCEMALLGVNRNGAIECDERQAGTKLLKCKVLSDGQLLREYAPAEDENGTKCLLEKVGSFVIYPQMKEAR